jgi:hypothetical protein
MTYSVPPGDYAISGERPASGVNIQAVMKLVYIWMGLGLLTTTVVAWLFGTNESLRQFATNPAVAIFSVIGTFGLVLVMSLGFNAKWMTPNRAMIFFFVYAALMGVMLSSVAYIATIPGLTSAVVSALMTTIVLFGVMTVFGFTTKMDLTKWGTYLMIGLIGLVIAMIVNIFLNSGALSMLISVVGVILFTALTAYDTQKIKEMTESYQVQADGNLALKFSILGALTLYLDFVNLFLFLLQLFLGNRE